MDGDLPFLAASPENIERLKSRSVGQYGPEVGAPRLLKVLGELGVPSTWFFPGQVALGFPDLVRAVDVGDHEVAVHGWAHRDFDTLKAADQIDEMTHGRDALVDVVGHPVRGFRTPAGEWARSFIPAMAAEGFAWSSSLPSDDQPFRLFESVVEIPFRYDLEDYQYLAYNLDPPFPPGQSRITPTGVVEANWWQEYLGALRWGTMFLLRLNAEVIGTPGRARMLRRFLQRIIDDGRAVFLTCGQIAATVPEGLSEEHPYQMFHRLFGAEQS